MTSDSTAKAAKQDKAATVEDVQEKLNKAAELLQSAVRPLMKYATIALPHVITITEKTYAFWVKLPRDYALVVIGLIFCLFGGLYPTLFATVMAMEHGGRKVVVAAIKDLFDEAVKIIEASKKDDDTDADGDGVKDVDQMSSQELLTRKAKLILTKMNPEKVDRALNSIYRVWLSVAAVLAVKFARTISMALTISEFLKGAVNRYLTPTVQLATPDEYDKWVPVIVGWITKSIGMSIAWYIQSIISAFTSALQGGLIVSRALMRIGRKKGFDFIPPDEDSMIDEVSSYVIAAAGFYFQFSMGFKAQFPLNLILWPFELAEYWIRWTITKST